MSFDAKKVTEELVAFVKDWFEVNGKGCNAIIGISGGKDSSVAAAVCAKALGKERVIGVLMPKGEQPDIEDSLELVHALGIKYFVVNIKDAVLGVLNSISEIDVSEQTKINLSPRIRMTTLYAISQSINGRVINTCNLSENMCGFSTLYGDHAGDVSLFDQLTVTEVRAIGHFLNLPSHLVDKAPSDGLCGKTDEDVYGFTYETLDTFIRTGVCDDEEIKDKIIKRYKGSKFKLKVIQFPHYDPKLKNYIEEQ